MTIIRRNPFARAEIHRTIVKTPKCSCAWCGQKRKSGNLFAFRVEADSISDRHADYKGLFCSTGCFDAYHDAPLKE